MIVHGYIQANIDWRSIVKDPGSLSGKVVKVYLLAKEGFSNPRILGGLSKPLEWTANAIKSLYSTVHTSIQAYAGHGETRIDESRPKVGNIVGSTLRDIGGKLHHYVAVASEKDHSYDVISMEADISYEDLPDKGIVNSIKQLTGVALGKKGKDVPGVEGAELVASMQFFEPEPDLEPGKPDNKENKKPMTIEEAIKMIKDNGIPATRIWTVPELVGKISFKEGKIEYEPGQDHRLADAIGRHFVHTAQSQIDTFAQKAKDADSIKESYQKVKSDLFQTQSSKHIETIVKERSLTPEHKTYLEKVSIGFQPKEKPEEEFKQFVDSKLDEFKGLVDAGLVKLSAKPQGANPPEPGSEGKSSSYEELLDGENDGKE
ncbi:hypothetical protein [Leptospira levettii]|uniref:hypothetical protein n=1 Tax=Leptospira levettii TaxID=2023178 RepID=UPI000C29A00D|nr:hypothetical protein [Leptospira levettii]PJZ87925.1 hypothetical protein CH368_14280 [Leptospira levettii]